MFRQSGAKAWRENYEALKERADDLDEENRAKDRQIERLTGQVDALTKQVKTLTDLVMGKRVPEALKEELTGATNRVIERIRDLEDNTASALGAVRNDILAHLQPPKEAS